LQLVYFVCLFNDVDWLPYCLFKYYDSLLYLSLHDYRKISWDTQLSVNLITVSEDRVNRAWNTDSCTSDM